MTFTGPASGASASITGSPAVISADGQVSVAAASNFIGGSYTVAATAAGIEGAATFSLTNYAVVTIAVTPGNPSLAVGVAAQFTATGTFTDGSIQNITDGVAWASATPSVATVGDTGVASALAVGTSKITASFTGITSPDDTLTVIAPSFVVNTTADAFGFYSGTTSLREAIASANVVPGQTITFGKSVFNTPQTITLGGTQLELTDTTGTESITGPAAGVTVSAGGNSRVFQVDGGVTASISGLTISGGNTSGNGGGLYNDGGNVTLTDCTVSDNSSTINVTDSGGGGIFSAGGSTILTNCTISGNSAADSGGGLFSVGGTTTLTDCTLSGNSAVRAGGGRFNLFGTATLTDCTVSSNSAGADGGVFVYGVTFTLTNCTVSGNSGRAGGGGLDLEFAATTLTNCTVSDNSAYYGRGVTNQYGTATLTNSTVNSNKASGPGGGLYNKSGALTMTNTTVSGNSATGGGGVFANRVTFALTNCTVSGNSAVGNGGGVFASGGTFALTNCTVSDNSAGISGGGVFTIAGTTLTATKSDISGKTARLDCGGLYTNGTTTLTDCTISGNSAGNLGGGLANFGGMTTLTNCTVSGNSAVSRGGGLDNFYGNVTLGNTIVAVNTAATGPDASGGITSLGNNLVGKTDASKGWVASDLTGTVATPLNPLLAPLGSYGGPTQTMALLPGSPALDAGNNALIPAGVTTDQRGLPCVVNGTVDIGAFESSGFTIAVASGSGQSADISEPFANPLVVTVTANEWIEPVAGGQVRFTAPASGATAALSVNPATIAANGTASTAASANVSPGTYTVTATATGVTSPAAFSLTNVASLVVNTTSDAVNTAPGVNTLRLAIFYANSFTTGSPTIIFDSQVFSTPQTITLAGTQLELSDKTGTETITGPAAGVTVSGGGNSRVFQVDANVTASISGLTITGGKTTGRGGGLYNDGGKVTLTNCTISGNSAGDGGGLDNLGTITLTNVTLSGNSASSSGGGLYSKGTATLTNCTVSGNFAAAKGGGVVGYGGSMMLTNCTLFGNSVGQSPGFGGGLWDNGTTTLTNCTISGNSAAGSGGGVITLSDDTTTLTNSTVSGNTAAGNGGGVVNYGSTTLGNTIVAGNTAATGPDVSGGITSQGNNLIGETDGSSGWVASDLTGTSAQPLDPLLAPLGNYGGPTQTMALLPGSPAIDAGDNALIPAGVTTDQRGSGFPRIVNGTVDIGAFESSGFTINVTSGSGQSTGVLTAFPEPLVVTVIANNPMEPVAGGLVTFTPPSSGASSAISGNPATISATGTVSVTATANAITGGSYAVSATARGITAPASFSLKNYQLIIALDASAPAALNVSGNAGINTSGVVYVDSSSSSALSASGNAQVKASAIDVHGKVQKSGNASLSPTPVTGAPVLAVASLPLPSTTGLTNHGSFSLSGNSSQTIQPGIYSSISVSGNAKLTMASGIYIIEGGGWYVAI